MSDPLTTCQVCQGTCQVWVDNPDGSPARQTTCPVCSGRGNTNFARERVNAWFDYWAWWRRAFALGFVGVWVFYRLDPKNSFNGFLFLAAVICLIGWVVMRAVKQPAYRSNGQLSRPEKAGKRRAPRHAPGFTDDREKAALGLFGGVVAGRTMWDAYQAKDKDAGTGAYRNNPPT